MRYKYPLPRDTRLNNMRNDAELLDHILAHIDNGTTDLGEDEWFCLLYTSDAADD